jgi:hypothetical protein
MASILQHDAGVLGEGNPDFLIVGERVVDGALAFSDEALTTLPLFSLTWKTVMSPR